MIFAASAQARFPASLQCEWSAHERVSGLYMLQCTVVRTLPLTISPNIFLAGGGGVHYTRLLTTRVAFACCQSGKHKCPAAAVL
jgi:hypothetical protein